MGTSDRKSITGKNFFKSVFLGGLAAFFCTVLLIFICSIMIYSGWMEFNQIRRPAIAACAISGFFSSFLFVRQLGRNSIPSGALIGIIQFILLLVLGNILAEAINWDSSLLPLLTACLCSGALAGFFAKKRRKRRRS